MSTRAHIAVYPLGVSMAQLLDEDDKLMNRKWEALLYVHSDGYPTSLLKQVWDFHQFFSDQRFFVQEDGYDGAYFAARLIQRLTNEYDKASRMSPPRYLLSGFGVTRVMYGDFDWFYAVTQDGVAVFHRRPGGRMKLTSLAAWDDYVARETPDKFFAELERRV